MSNEEKKRIAEYMKRRAKWILIQMCIFVCLTVVFVGLVFIYQNIDKTYYITYKENIILIEANKYYPSSKKCNKCGLIKKELKLSERIYKCNKCGLVIDRDINAAINLANYSY